MVSLHAEGFDQRRCLPEGRPLRLCRQKKFHRRWAQSSQVMNDINIYPFHDPVERASAESVGLYKWYIEGLSTKYLPEELRIEDLRGEAEIAKRAEFAPGVQHWKFLALAR